MMSPRILPRPRIDPNQSGRSDAGSGASCATGLPRLVITIGSRETPTSSISRRQVCLNRPAGIVRIEPILPWTLAMDTSAWWLRQPTEARERLVDLLVGDDQRRLEPDRSRTGRVDHESLLEQRAAGQLWSVEARHEVNREHQPAAPDRAGVWQPGETARQPLARGLHP